ncbi:MAG: hypothetical protein ACE5GE_08920 [Phycisphaerae bacterium]
MKTLSQPRIAVAASVGVIVLSAGATINLADQQTRACTLTCPPTGIPEGEPACFDGYLDTTNAGCDNPVGLPTFTPIACGQTICGASGTFLGPIPCASAADCPPGESCTTSGICTAGPYPRRDTDWYRFELTEATLMELCITADVPIRAGIVDTAGMEGCTAGGFVAELLGQTTCQSACTTTSNCIPAGTWYLFVAPIPQTGVPCDSSYRVDLNCLPFGCAGCSATAARSCQQHTEGRLCLDLDVPPGSGGSNVEPRLGQVNDIEIDLDVTPASVAVASVDCTDNGGVTTSHLAEVATTTLIASTVNVTFTPALPDNQVCVITLDCGASVCVRGLRGDVDRNGTVTTGDASQVRFFFNQTATQAGPQWDYDQENGVTTGDFSQIRFFFNSTVPTCP